MSVPPPNESMVESERWSNFKVHLEQIHQSNIFQKNRFPGLANFQLWNSFQDFSQACPLTTKQELENDRLSDTLFGTNRTFPVEHYIRFSQTSGTSGKSITWMDTKEDWNWMLANWAHILNQAGVTRNACCLFAFSFGPFLGFWTAYEAAIARGCVCIPSGGQSTESRLLAILKHRVEYLFCTPTYALRMIECARETGTSLKDNYLKKIIVAGEPGGSQQVIREKVDQAWIGESLLFDHYGMTEVGPVAYECPGGQGSLRVHLDAYHAEVINQVTGRGVEDGEIGELVLTPLGRLGSPVFRYRTGDLVRPKRTFTKYGIKTFDLIGGVLGRADDMVVIRGVNLYPSGLDEIVRKFPEINEYQVIIEEFREMAEIFVRAECGKEVARSLEIALRNAFSLRIPVYVEKEGCLPRTEMKANRWIRKA